MRVLLDPLIPAVHRRHRHPPLEPPLPLELRLVVRRVSARLPDPLELPGEDAADFLLVEIHELRDSSPVSAPRHAEIGDVSARDEVAEGVVVEPLEAQHSRHSSVRERVLHYSSKEGFLSRSFKGEGFGEERLEGLEAAVVVCVGADVEEAAREAVFAGDLLEGEVGAVDEGEEDVESVGALGGRRGGVFVVGGEGRVVAGESRPVFGGEGGLVEGYGAEGRSFLGLERDILYLVSDVNFVGKMAMLPFPRGCTYHPRA